MTLDTFVDNSYINSHLQNYGELSTVSNIGKHNN